MDPFDDFDDFEFSELELNNTRAYTGSRFWAESLLDSTTLLQNIDYNTIKTYKI